MARYQQPLPQDFGYWGLVLELWHHFYRMLQDFETWNKYQQIIWFIAFVPHPNWLMWNVFKNRQSFGEGHSGFKFIPIITRDPKAALHDRLPILIGNGELEKAAGLALNPASSHVMLCGNPQMVEDTKEALNNRFNDESSW